MVYAGFEAGRTQELKYKNCRAKIFYPGVEAGKKYCLYREWSQQERLSIQRFKDSLGRSRKTNTIFPTLRPCWKYFFSEIILENKNVFIFWQGNCMMNVLHPSLSKSFALKWNEMKWNHIFFSINNVQFMILQLDKLWMLGKKA